MEQVHIAYDFRFVLTVRKRNGKTYKKHVATATGLSYEAALWEVQRKFKRSKTEILCIEQVSAIRIAFAFQGEERLKLSLSDHPPKIPQELCACADHLTKKRIS